MKKFLKNCKIYNFRTNFYEKKLVVLLIIIKTEIPETFCKLNLYMQTY